MASLNASVVTNLRCEYLNDPLGIDITKPHLSWVIEEAAGCRGIQQAAYQVLVASTGVASHGPRRFVGQWQGVKFLRMENNAAVYAVGSGSYRFQSKMP